MTRENMHITKTLKSIYEEHCGSVPLMVETLLYLDVPNEDALLLGKMPWEFPANRIAAEREKLGLSPVHPLLHFKPLPPPPHWLTPAMCKKIFELALEYQPDETEADAQVEEGDGLVLPA